MAMIVAVDGPIATIRLNRPEQRNRIEPADLDELASHLDAIDRRPEVRVLILASTGKTFSAGFHLGAIDAEAPARFEQVADALASCRMPSIAALQGSVYGGAADLALACDFRVGVAGMKLLVPPARLGIPYYASGIERFVNRLSLGAAKRILLGCETIEAGALLEIGYLDEVVEADSLEARVAERAQALASHAPLAMEAMKRMLNDAARSKLDRESASRAIRDCLSSADHREGLEALSAKRIPNFRRS